MTDSDIQNFANLTWDHFYAHTDITSLDGSIFEQRTAHGYFLLALAAGLFVYPGKGPVGANYGLDSCRFIRPVYHNDTLQVRLTCKEKVDRDSRGKEHPCGVVKWYEEILDAEGELVATAVILTLVQKKSPFQEVSRDWMEEKLAGLTEDTKPAWGMMTAQHMVEHLEYWHTLSIDTTLNEIITPEKYLEDTQDSLWNYKPMAKEFQHPSLRKGELEDLRFGSLEEAKKALLVAYDAHIAFFKENPKMTTTNSVFGELDRYHYQILNRKHYNHHFGQFGLI